MADRKARTLTLFGDLEAEAVPPGPTTAQSARAAFEQIASLIGGLRLVFACVRQDRLANIMTASVSFTRPISERGSGSRNQ